MTVNRRAAKALRQARDLLREAAVAEYTARSDHRMRVQARRDAVAEELDDALAAAARSLEAASSVEQLSRVAQELQVLRLRVEDAEDAYRAAASCADVAAARLRERSRQAYCAAQLVERADRAHSTHEQRQEQHRHDDLPRRTTHHDD